MRVSDLMQADLETVSPDTSVNDVFVSLAESRVSALPVVDESGRLVGVISKTDIVASEEDSEGEAGRAALFETMLVRDLMTSPALTIGADASIRAAAQQMLSTGVHRLFVVGGEREIRELAHMKTANSSKRIVIDLTKGSICRNSICSRYALARPRLRLINTTLASFFYLVSKFTARGTDRRTKERTDSSCGT